MAYIPNYFVTGNKSGDLLPLSITIRKGDYDMVDLLARKYNVPRSRIVRNMVQEMLRRPALIEEAMGPAPL